MPGFFKVEIPRDVEAKVDIPLTPCAGGLGEVLGGQHALGVTEYELEDVAAGFDIPAKGKRVVDGGGHDLVLRNDVIFGVDAHPPGDLHPAAEAKGEDIVLVVDGWYEIVMQVGRGHLQGQVPAELAGDEQFGRIGRPPVGVQIQFCVVFLGPVGDGTEDVHGD